MKKSQDNSTYLPEGFYYDCYRFQEMASKFENALQEPHGIAQQGNDVW